MGQQAVLFVLQQQRVQTLSDVLAVILTAIRHQDFDEGFELAQAHAGNFPDLRINVLVPGGRFLDQARQAEFEVGLALGVVLGLQQGYQIADGEHAAPRGSQLARFFAQVFRHLIELLDDEVGLHKSRYLTIEPVSGFASQLGHVRIVDVAHVHDQRHAVRAAFQRIVEARVDRAFLGGTEIVAGALLHQLGQHLQQLEVVKRQMECHQGFEVVHQHRTRNIGFIGQ